MKVWDGDRDMAATLANAIMDKLQEVHQDVQTSNNAMMLTRIEADGEEKKIEYRKLSDSVQHAGNSPNADLINLRKTSLLQQIQEYDKLADQYKLMVEARPRALVVIEKASPPLKADEPKRLEIIVAAAVLGLFFGVLCALALDKRIAAK